MSISKKRLADIESIPDEDIDYSEIPEADNDFWGRAELHMPQPKQGVYVRLDAMLRVLMESDSNRHANAGSRPHAHHRLKSKSSAANPPGPTRTEIDA